MEGKEQPFEKSSLRYAYVGVLEPVYDSLSIVIFALSMLGMIRNSLHKLVTRYDQH